MRFGVVWIAASLVAGQLASADSRGGASLDIGAERQADAVLPPSHGIPTEFPPTSIVVPIPGTFLIDFDDGGGACNDNSSTLLRDQYADLGVRFDGVGVGSGGHVLQPCYFPAHRLSRPRFVQLHPAIAPGPQIISFHPSVSFVQIGIGNSGGEMVTIEAFDASGGSVDTATWISTAAMNPVTVTGAGITRIVISYLEGATWLDDLVFKFDAPDADGDTLPDELEVAQGCDPSNPDSDGDGLTDGFEVAYRFPPTVPGDHMGDPDADGLDNLGEQLAGVNPRKADTDRDQLTDGAEVHHHVTDPRLEDTDGGGAPDAREITRDSTNPLTAGDDRPLGRGVVVDIAYSRALSFESTAQAFAGSSHLSGLPLLDCVISPDGRRTFISGFNFQIHVAELERSPPELARGPNPINQTVRGEDMVITPDGRFLIACGSPADRTISVIDVKTQQEISTFPTTSGCTAVDACGNGSVLVAYNGISRLERLTIDDQGHLSATGDTHFYRDPMNVYCSPDGRTGFVLGALGSSLSTFRVPGFRFIRGLLVSGTAAVSGVVAPDGAKVYVRSGAGYPGWIDAFAVDPVTARLSEAPLFRLQVPSIAAYYGVEQLALDPSGERLYVPAYPEGIRVFDATTGAQLPGPQGEFIPNHAGICLATIGDRDRDGRSDENERAGGTHADDPDSDDDELLDGFEVAADFDPLVPGEAHRDDDGDGLDNLQEQLLGTLPLVADSDRDGSSDGAEITEGSDPREPDTDGDALDDGPDNCPTVANPSQPDVVHPDGVGDDCDDPDHDGLPDRGDNCPDTANPSQINADSDARGDACDLCPLESEGFACLEFPSPSGTCIDATVDLVPRSANGTLSIRRRFTGFPDTIDFEVLGWLCQDGDAYEVTLNGAVLGHIDSRGSWSCSCAPVVQRVTIRDASLIAAHWNPGGVNTIGFRKANQVSRIFWARIVAHKDVEDQRVCLFDAGGGDCTAAYGCEDKSVTNPFETSVVALDQISSSEPVQIASFTDSSLPDRLEIGALSDEEYDLCVVSSDPGSGRMYATNQYSQLFTIDLNTAASTAAGSASEETIDLEYDASTGRTYILGWNRDVRGTTISETDLTTPASLQRPVLTDTEFGSLEWLGSELLAATGGYANQNSELKRLDPVTGISTLIGPTSVGGLGGLAYDPATDRLFGIESFPRNALVSIDRATGEATVIRPYIGFWSDSLEMGPDGWLYSLDSVDIHSPLYRINPQTGATIRVGTTGIYRVQSLAFVHDPAPFDCRGFTKRGEQYLTINGAPCSAASPPTASISGSTGPHECTSPAGALVSLSGVGSSDPDGDIETYEWFENYGAPSQVLLGTDVTLTHAFALGFHDVTLRVTDGEGNADVDAVTVAVLDTVPPKLTLSVTPTVLWPPNHRMVNVTATVTTQDLCGPSTFTLSSILNSETDDAVGLHDGETHGDIDASIGTADTEFALRAERAGSGPGRVYTVTYRGDDVAGNSASKSVAVLVPHDQGGSVEPLAVTLWKDRDRAIVSWIPVPGAHFYNVVRGDVRKIRRTAEVTLAGPVTCLANGTTGTAVADTDAPTVPGEVLFYAVEYDDGARSSYGTESAGRPLVVSPGEGACP